MALTGMAIAAIAAPAVGGVIGGLMSHGDKKRAQAAIQAALAQYSNINIPDEEKMKLALQSPTVQGILQPYMQQAEQLQQSSMENINIDPRLRQAQMQALETLSKMGEQGLTAEDRTALNQARRQVAGDAQARQGAILQNMAARGMGGSGVELAARLSESQDSADRSSQEADRLMAMAQRRMLEGVSAAAATGGQIRGQDYGEQENLARARDAIQQFNAQQRAGTQAANIGALNQSQAQNLAEKQRIADVGVQTSNQQQQYNKQLAQQTFNNQMQLANAKANSLLGAASNYQNQAAQTGSMYSGIGSGIGQGLLGYETLKAKKNGD